MKKIITGILSILTIGCLAVGMAGCEEQEVESTSTSEEVVSYSENLAYIISEDESYYILRGVGLCADRRIIIPSTYRGLPVKEIGDRAFQVQNYISSIFIPDSVTSIGDEAFYYCTSLMSVVIPDSVTSIGDGAFSYCDGLTSVAIPDSVTSIGVEAFSSCTSLTSVVIGNSVTSIGDRAFFYCTSLTSIEFTGTVAQWNAISKESDWNDYAPATEVICSDGRVAI